MEGYVNELQRSCSNDAEKLAVGVQVESVLISEDDVADG